MGPFQQGCRCYAYNRERRSIRGKGKEDGMSRKGSGAIDVTEGVIWRQILQLAWPIILSSFFQQAYTLINAYVVGQFSTKEVLGGIQATAALCDLLLMFCIGIGSGCAVMAGQFFGAKHRDSLSRSVHTAYALAILMGAIAAVLGLIFIRPILVLMHTPAELLDEALIYGRWYFATMVFWLCENMSGAILRAVGDTRTPTVVVGIACLLNGILDVIFVVGFGMGAMGIGIATFLSVGFAAAAMSFALIRADGAWRLRLRDVRIHRDLVGSMLKIGIPLGFQASAYSISNIIVQSSMNRLGADMVTAWGLQGRLTSASWLILEALGIAAMTFAAQNFGAKNIARLRRGTRVSLGLSAAASLMISAVLLLGIEPITRFFIDDAQIVSQVTYITHFLSAFYLFYGLSDVISGVIRGAGESLRPMAITLLGTCLFRIVWLEVLFRIYPKLETVLISYPLSWILTAAIFVVYYRKGHWLDHAEEREAKIMSI